MGLSGRRVAETGSLQVESLSQDGGYDSLEFIGEGGKPADIPLPVPVMPSRVLTASQEGDHRPFLAAGGDEGKRLAGPRSVLRWRGDDRRPDHVHDAGA
jgi:hypothetical protein